MDERIKTVLEYISSHLPSVMRHNDLADIACLSPSQFHRVFKRETGETPFTHIERKRIEEAKRLVLESRESIRDIALDVGYNDYETFSRAFRRQTGLSPDDMRSIAISIESTMVSEPGVRIQFGSIKESDDVVKRIEELAAELDLPVTALDETNVFVVKRKQDSGAVHSGKQSINRKFELEAVDPLKKKTLPRS